MMHTEVLPAADKRLFPNGRKFTIMCRCQNRECKHFGLPYKLPYMTLQLEKP